MNVPEDTIIINVILSIVSVFLYLLTGPSIGSIMFAVVIIVCILSININHNMPAIDPTKQVVDKAMRLALVLMLIINLGLRWITHDLKFGGKSAIKPLTPIEIIQISSAILIMLLLSAMYLYMVYKHGRLLEMQHQERLSKYPGAFRQLILIDMMDKDEKFLQTMAKRLNLVACLAYPIGLAVGLIIYKCISA